MKKTPTQKYIDDAVNQAVEKSSKGSHIESCNFVGVQYDAKAVEAIDTIAKGLVENAKALGKLAEVLNSSNVEIETMLKLEQ